MKTDDFESSVAAREAIADRRAVHYWDADQSLGKAFKSVVTLPESNDTLAWDIYFVYEPGVSWGDDPPGPSAWWHQLAFDEQYLGDGTALRDALRGASETEPSTASVAPSGCPVIGQPGKAMLTTRDLACDGCEHADAECAAPACGAGNPPSPGAGHGGETAYHQVVAYLEGVRDTATSETIRLSRAEMEKALGFRPEEQILMDALAVVFPDAVSGGGATRCADYGACSLYGDLSSAEGATLAMYEDEKRQDGLRFDDSTLPSFTARTLDGEQVSSTDLRGQPTLVVPLAVHCSHSYDTLPILHDLTHAYGPKGLRVVGLLVNSGSAADVTQSLQGFPACHDIWVTEGDSVGKLLEARLVPSHLLVTDDGRVVRKFVGFKNSGMLKGAIEELLGS